MNKKNLLLAVALTSSLSGCSLFLPKINPPADYDPKTISQVKTSFEWIQLPDIGSIYTAKLGDSLVSTSTKFGNYEILLNKNIEFYPDNAKAKEMLSICKSSTLPKGRYIAMQESSNYLYYFLVPPKTGDVLDVTSLNVETIFCTNNTKNSLIGLRMDKQTKELVPWITRIWNIQAPMLNKSDYSASFVKVSRDDNFKQELYFNGQSGSTLKFMYREFSGSFIRSNFSQEVVYDLKGDNQIGFKDALLEIESTSNTEIKYKVLKHFSPKH